MRSEVELLPLAESDLADAMDWYESRRPGLGQRFLDHFLDCTDRIVEMPGRFERVCGDYRRALIHHFPYAVFFRREAEKIVVYSVFHCAQDPVKWQSRLS